MIVATASVADMAQTFSPLTREKLLRKPCSYRSTAVNMAVVSGSPKMVDLLEWAIKLSNRLRESSKEIPSLNHEDSVGRENSVSSLFHGGNMQTVITSDIGDITPAPDLKDEDVNILVTGDGILIGKVISVIEGVLEDPGIQKEVMDKLKDRCQKDLDFEFVPVAHVILHYIFSITDSFSAFLLFRIHLLREVVRRCKFHHEEGEEGSMLVTLFNILDARGRTILHAAFEGDSFDRMLTIFEEVLRDVPVPIMAECLNAKDSADRTILHQTYIHDKLPYYFRCSERRDCISEMNLSSPQDSKLDVLKDWCFPNDPDIKRIAWEPSQLAAIFNYRYPLPEFWLSNGLEWCGMDYPRFTKSAVVFRLMNPFHLAAALGRIESLELILKCRSKLTSPHDPGFGNIDHYEFPALHCAAYFGQVEAIQTFLKYPAYDPIVQHGQTGTALHYLLNSHNFELDIGYLHTVVLFHLLPNSTAYERLKNDFPKLHCPEKYEPRMYSENEMSCINLLLQAGIDIWTPHCEMKEPPGPGPMASNEAREWWFDKVVQEVVTVKTSVSYAANATSVVAALVATASFIGPFQPPLGYGDSKGYVRTDRSPVRVFLVCNNLSFFFSVASILMALLLAIPMPKESLYDELLPSQRCLKGAALLLLISIICFLISFASASLAVVSSEWRERQLVVACVVCGGLICAVILAIYMIRMLRMLFHRNNWFRRKFARYMYF